jgi:hypothetical protein
MHFKFKHRQPFHWTTKPVHYNQDIPLIHHLNAQIKWHKLNTPPWLKVLNYHIYSPYIFHIEPVGIITKLVAPRSHMISCYKKFHICSLLVHSCPLHQVISGNQQLCPNHISPLNIIGCIRGTTIQNLYPVSGTWGSKKTKPNSAKSTDQLEPSPSCPPLLLFAPSHL